MKTITWFQLALYLTDVTKNTNTVTKGYIKKVGHHLLFGLVTWVASLLDLFVENLISANCMVKIYVDVIDETETK